MRTLDWVVTIAAAAALVTLLVWMVQGQGLPPPADA